MRLIRMPPSEVFVKCKKGINVCKNTVKISKCCLSMWKIIKKGIYSIVKV